MMPFERMVAAVEDLPLEEVVLQHGPAEPPRGASKAVPFMPLDEVVDHMRSADKVISHAGVGSVLSAVRAGHVPVVVPRLRRFSETVDDHQLQLAQALARRRKVITVEDPAKLASAVAAAPPKRPSTARRAGALHSTVRELVAA
jgi:UDP-N-acetylglucosamine transferase subunit ALG13